MKEIITILTKSKWIYIEAYKGPVWEYRFNENYTGNSLFRNIRDGDDLVTYANCDWSYKLLSDTSIEITFEDESTEIVDLLIEESQTTITKENDPEYKYVFKKKIFTSKHIFENDCDFPFETYDAKYTQFLGDLEIRPNIQVSQEPIEVQGPTVIDFETFFDPPKNTK